MAMMTLGRMVADLTRWSEGDDILHERFSPGSTVETFDGRDCVVNWFRHSRIAEQSYSVGVAATPKGDRLLSRRTWYEGMDAWEAAGRPSDPALRPRHVGLAGVDLPVNGGSREVRAFHAAVTALHVVYTGGLGRREGEARILAAVEGIEEAMRAIEATELRAAGVPDWLIGAGEEEEPAGPRM